MPDTKKPSRAPTGRRRGHSHRLPYGTPYISILGVLDDIEELSPEQEARDVELEVQIRLRDKSRIVIDE